MDEPVANPTPITSREEALVIALKRAYQLVFNAYDNDRFGAANARCEVKELRREMAGVLSSVGIESPYDGGLYPQLDPWEQSARMEQEAVLRWLNSVAMAEVKAATGSEHGGCVADCCSYRLAIRIAAGEHRKG